MTRRRLSCGPELTDQVAEFVRGLVEQAGLSEERAYWLHLAADEITTNIAHHGYHDDEAGVVDLESGMDERQAWLRIEDDAPAFDPSEFDPSHHLSLEPAQRPGGGFGLFLVQGKVDRFEYRWTNGRNRNDLWMWRGPRPTGGETSGGRTTGMQTTGMETADTEIRRRDASRATDQ